MKKLRTLLVLSIFTPIILSSTIAKPSIHFDKINNTSSNVIVLFGWTNSAYNDVKTKHKLLTTLDVGTIITVTTPTKDLLFNEKNLVGVINILHSTLTTRYKNNNIYILYYSGGGSVYYPIVHTKFNQSLVKGHIFDSAPVPFEQNVFLNWIQNKINNNFLKTFVGYVLYFPMYLIFNTKLCNNILHDYNNYIQNTSGNIQTLIITSKNDLLVPMSTLKKLPDAEILMFDNSDHLEHDVIYPNEYIDKIKEFIKNNE